MKSIMTVSLMLFFLGCSNLPSYHEMSCKELIKKEKSLQQDYSVNSIGSLASGILDAIDNTTDSKVDSIVADAELENTKRDLHNVQAEISKRHCKK